MAGGYESARKEKIAGDVLMMFESTISIFLSNGCRPRDAFVCFAIGALVAINLRPVLGR